MSEKLYLDAQELLEDLFRLATNIYNSGFQPTFIVAVWRGGAPIGIAAIIKNIRAKLRRNTPEQIRVAVPYYNPNSPLVLKPLENLGSAGLWGFWARRRTADGVRPHQGAPTTPKGPTDPPCGRSPALR